VRLYISILFVIAIFSSQSCEAQLLIGPTFGGQISWINVDEKGDKDFYDIKPKWGYHAGFGLSFRVRKRFFLTSSFLYSTKGKSVEGTSNAKADNLLKHNVTYKYIDIPIIYSVDFRAKVGPNTEFKYFVGLGPNISYWLGGKGTLYNTIYSENQIPELEFKIAFNKDENEAEENEMTIKDPNRVQLGLNLAAGIVLEPVPFQKFMFVIRYELGHSYLSNEGDGHFPNTTYKDNLRTRVQGVRASLFYMIDIRTEERKKGKSTIKSENKKRRRK
jgi:hypothetical protein